MKAYNTGQRHFTHDLFHILRTIQVHFTSEVSAPVLLPGSRRSLGKFLLPGKWPPAAPLQPLACDYSSLPFPSTKTITEDSIVHLWYKRMTAWCLSDHSCIFPKSIPRWMLEKRLWISSVTKASLDSPEPANMDEYNVVIKDEGFLFSLTDASPGLSPSHRAEPTRSDTSFGPSPGLWRSTYRCQSHFHQRPGHPALYSHRTEEQL